MRRPVASSSPPEELFPVLKRTLIERTGQFYYQDKDDLLWERVQRRIAALKLPDLAAYLARLNDPDRGEAEWIALEAEITIGETFFFRYAEQFEALRRTILPEILARRAAERRIRVWSAGCSNGAEAYSVAIVLHELLGDALPDWRVSILGTDINADLLEAARAARFSDWSLRSMPADARSRWFTRGGPREWVLRPGYRALARFARGNLLDLINGRAPIELTEFDLILCRNVLIYFEPNQVLALVAGLGERLTAGGWLLLGHAETSPVFGEMLEQVSLAGATAFRREGGSPIRPPEPPSLAPPQLSPAPSLPSPTAWTPPAAWTPPPALPAVTPPPAAAAAPAGAPSEDDDLGQIRRRADAGDLDGAASACRRALERTPQSAVLHYYLGLAERGLDRLAEAERAFRRAVYLDPELVMAHFQLGLLLADSGRAAAGHKAIAAAARLAGTLAVDERLQEGAGLTAGELRELSRLQLQAGQGGRKLG